MFNQYDLYLFRIGRAVRRKQATSILNSAVRKTTPTFQTFGVNRIFTRNHSTIGNDARRNLGSMAVAHQAQEPDVAPSISEAWTFNLRGDECLDGSRDRSWYTGKAPAECPGYGSDGVLRSLAAPNLSKVTRQATRDYFDNTWTLFEEMFSGLNGEAPFYQPPQHGLRHPQIFYYGHPTCFYVNKLQVAGILSGPVDTYLESVLEVGVDEMLWDDMHKFDDPWPTVSRVKEYRKKVYQIVCDVIANHPELDDNGGSTPVTITPDHQCWALFMGFEHERIHLETSSVLFREMPRSHVQHPASWPAPFQVEAPTDSNPVRGTHFPASNPMLPVSGAAVTLGKPTDHPSYGWDNEYGTRTINVPDFSASKFMVTNGEFYEFVQAGGYTKEQYWSEAGWQWRKFRNMKWPFFWQQNGPQGSLRFKLRAIFDVIDMPWSAPVDINHYEALAYCAWRSEQDGLAGTPRAYRLITEAEHHLIRPKAASLDNVRKSPLAERVMHSDGANFLKRDSNTNANLNLACGSQTPVDALLPSETGHHDTMGNGWEWAMDHFNSLDGYKFHDYYTDFSTPCFDGRHNLILGGSFMSTGDMASIFARFHFRPHFLQHSGFRLVSSSQPAPATYLDDPETAKNKHGGKGSDNIYETDDLVHQYLGFHFATESGKAEGISAILPHDNAPEHALRFPQRVAELLTKLQPTKTNGRVLDVGCSVGGSSFELATQYDEVVGFDFSQAFVDAAIEMQTAGEMKFNLTIEAGLAEPVIAVHEKHVDQKARSRITFQTGDACEMDKIEGTFDGAVVANLLCRVPKPLACLDGLASKINQGGVVVLATPFSWLDQFTDQSEWLGGYCDGNGEPVFSKNTLKAEMEARGFMKIHEEQMPVLIREHQRKYQYIVSEATGWRKM